MLNEFELIERFRQAAQAHATVELGIGDDTAILRATAPETRTLVTVDLLAEGTHFTFPPATPREVGHKLLGVNLSDIAAMAGQPETAFVSLLLPRQRGSEFALELMAGLRDLADEFGVAIAGGDTNVWNGPLVASLTLLGSAGAGGAVRRQGAQPGDWLLVTGALGGSLESGRHLRVSPRVREAQQLAEFASLHAMLDLSDGLSRDLQHLTVEQGLGAILYADRIPIHPDVSLSLSPQTRLRNALNDGEDFELLFAVTPEDGRRLLQASPVAVAVTHIGECTLDKVVRLRSPDGQELPLAPAGFEHQF